MGMIQPLTKPARGDFRRERLARADAERSQRDANKRLSKKRDGFKCRWPHVCRKGDPLESAHLVNLSQGGSDETSNLITLCQSIHNGQRGSLHSQERHIEPLTDMGADSVCAFYERHPETGRVECVAIERVIGISEARS